MCERNTGNVNFIDLTFDGDKRLTAGRQRYRVNNDIIFWLKSGFIVYIHMNQM